jgi:hypothetical protein
MFSPWQNFKSLAGFLLAPRGAWLRQKSCQSFVGKKTEFFEMLARASF